MNQCKACESDPYKYNFFVHGYFIPWLENREKDWKIRWGRFFCIKVFISQDKTNYKRPKMEAGINIQASLTKTVGLVALDVLKKVMVVGTEASGLTIYLMVSVSDFSNSSNISNNKRFISGLEKRFSRGVSAGWFLGEYRNGKPHGR